MAFSFCEILEDRGLVLPSMNSIWLALVDRSSHLPPVCVPSHQIRLALGPRNR
ncbi:rCG40732 [Rattus norvegicus]|uniref:RCG40732 n=1 Tax=Rattus norvegicus TaxID=10116 RepID=A6KSW2_RAT|nr:rCG40732 [Rattus norvegicus]